MNWQMIVQKMVRKIGYEVHKSGIRGEYTWCPPYDYSTYSPWFEDWFLEIYNKVSDRTLCTEDRCYIIYRFCNHCLHLEGDFAECGVYKGGTAFLIANTLMKNSFSERQVHLFDTFAGMPATANEDPSTLKEGDFGDVSVNAVKDYLEIFPRVVFHPGFIPKTFEAVEDKKFAFVHIDVDLYQTAKDCYSFFYDRMARGGVMICDDYGFPFFKYSAKQAVDEFFRDKSEKPISLPTGQCVIIKL